MRLSSFGAAALALLGCGGAIEIAASDDAASDARADAGSDALGTPDAPDDGGGRDAESDAAAEASAPRWCDSRSPAPAFCDDFDRGTLGATWDFFQQSPPGVATQDLATFVSAPASFGIVTTKLAAQDYGSILLRKTVSGGAARVRLAFDVYADAAQTSGTLAIATLDLSLAHLFTLYLRDDDPSAPGATLTELAPGGAQVRNTFNAAPAPGVWTHVELDLDAAGGAATLSFAGAKILDAVPIAKAAVQDPTIRVGALVQGPASSYTFRFDDVTVDVFR